jgi:small subunit ribosomal protein S16
VATKIKLMRLGKKHDPQYRIIVADARAKRDGRAIETIGKYHPKQDPSLIEVDSDRAQYWLSVGAQPTEPVLAILKRTGDWQKFKKLPAPEPLLTAAPRADKRALFEAAAKEAAAEPGAEATTPKKKSGRKAAKSGDAAAQGGDKPAEQSGEPGAQADASAEK